eukprot:5912382-Pleurochrysis_carterae.AAC.1
MRLLSDLPHAHSRSPRPAFTRSKRGVVPPCPLARHTTRVLARRQQAPPFHLRAFNNAFSSAFVSPLSLVPLSTEVTNA